MSGLLLSVFVSMFLFCSAFTNANDRENKLLQAYAKSCNHAGSFDPRKVWSMVRAQDKFTSVQIGWESWNALSIEELHAPQAFFRFDNSTAFPFTYLSHGPKKMQAGLASTRHMGVIQDRMEAVSFSKHEVLKRKDWISKHIWPGFNGSFSFVRQEGEPVNRDQQLGRYMATLNVFLILEKLAASEEEFALIVEDDVIGVPNFSKKLGGVVKQLQSLPNGWDIAFVGTCFRIDPQEQVRKKASPNLLAYNQTQCFSAVLMTRDCARRVLNRGAMSAAASVPSISFPADFLFNLYIPELNLRGFVVDPPLAHETSKTEQTFTCKPPIKLWHQHALSSEKNGKINAGTQPLPRASDLPAGANQSVYTFCAPSQSNCAPYRAENAVAGGLPTVGNRDVQSARQRAHHDMFLALAASGYVIFGKESNSVRCNGDCIEYGLLLLNLDGRSALAGAGSTQYGSVALRESYGFLEYSAAEWQLKKTIHWAQMGRQIKPSVDTGRAFYQSNWEPSWSCAFEQRVGVQGDGGRWICDAYKIAGQQECLVVAIGSNNDFRFEESVLQLNPRCEVHTFDHTVGSTPSNKPPQVHFHPIGLGSRNEGKLRTMGTILADLGISGPSKMVDVLKLDCEGCEFLVYPELVGKPIRQILMEIHYGDSLLRCQSR